MLVLSFWFNIVAVRILFGSNVEAPDEQREQDKHRLLCKVWCWAATTQGDQLGVVFVPLTGSSPSTMSKSAIFLWVGAALGTQEPFWFEVPRVRIQLGIMQYCTMKNPINSPPHLRKAKESAY